MESSTNNFELILDAPAYLPPKSGSWLAWLGGANEEISIIKQEVRVTAAQPFLSYWLRIDSVDICSEDVGGVLINGKAEDAYYLCLLNNTDGWIRRTVNLNDYAGQTVELMIAATNDSSLRSSLLVDDVSFSNGTALAYVDGRAKSRVLLAPAELKEWAELTARQR